MNITRLYTYKYIYLFMFTCMPRLTEQNKTLCAGCSSFVRIFVSVQGLQRKYEDLRFIFTDVIICN